VTWYISWIIDHFCFYTQYFLNPCQQLLVCGSEQWWLWQWTVMATTEHSTITNHPDSKDKAQIQYNISSVVERIIAYNI
jgi:hypothetical protein